MGVRFKKMHGAGNDFIVITGPDAGRDWTPQDARELCTHRMSIGADGLVTSSIVNHEPAVMEVTCLNADGSTASMCGNALRCAAWCASRETGVDQLTLVMAGVKHHAVVEPGTVWVTAEVGEVRMRCAQAAWKDRPVWFDAAHTGTEHVVTIVKDLSTLDVEAFGRIIRHHPALAPVGTNVNFVQHTGSQSLTIRTYERGVEAETLSCGSGAVAAVVISTTRGLVAAREVTVHNQSGSPLTVRPHADRPGRAFWVGGPVTCVYKGELA
jgi:diaminopimelate epimerase